MESLSEVAIGLKRNPYEALKTALSKLSTPIVPQENSMHVLIKPSIYDPSLPGNTHPRMIHAVIQMFSSLGPISLVESDNPIRTTKQAFTQSGYDAFENSRVKLVNLSDDEMISVRFSGHYFEERKMPQILQTNGFLINVATLKAEPEICTIGAGIKNLFGLLPELDKSVYHNTIDSILMDLLIAYRPNLTVIDLTDIVIGNRDDGQSMHVGGVIVGTDPVAVDSFCADLLGIDPLAITHIRTAQALGLGEALLDRIKVRGTAHQIEELNRIFKK